MAGISWTDVNWKIEKVDGLVGALFNGGTGSHRNTFWLDSILIGKTECLMVKYRSNSMTSHWEDLTFVARGKKSPKLPRNAADLLAQGNTPENLRAAAAMYIDFVSNSTRRDTARLECDLVLPIPKVGGGARKVFGCLRLFQFPEVLAKGSFLVLHFGFDGQPGGTGGGGSVHT